MKRYVLKLVILLLFVSSIFSSCKKGEEDPFLSFRSRDARIVGSWQLKNSEGFHRSQDIIIRSNDVNNDVSTNDHSDQRETTFDGSIKKVKTLYLTEIDSETTEFDDIENKFVTDIVASIVSQEKLEEYSYSANIKINKDFTYSYTYSETILKTTISNFDGEDTTTTITEYADQEIISRTQTGDWFWHDSKKKKVIINAGLMNGSILRLTNKEVIIDNMYSSSNNTNHSNLLLFPTNDDIENPENEVLGLNNTISNSNSENTSYQEWEAN